ncbi:MAG: recombinase family protein [Clostridiales bacterium]|nr:recombinase family protein [Clostridiales bacterium]
MLRDSEKQLFDLVLVYKIDRFSRNRYDIAICKAKLNKNHVKVISVTEYISDTPEGIMLESMLEGMAEYYSANLSQNVKRGQRVARERGTFTGGKAPYGYRVENKRVVVDETETEALRYVFSEYAAGTRLRDIIDYLNEKGYKPRTGLTFTVNSMQVALRNRKYLGEFVVGGVNYPDVYPQIIDNDTFAAVQKRIDAVRRAPAAGKAKVDYLLQGKAFCGHCGANMVGESGRGRNGNTHNYYACAAKKKEHTCDKKNERKDALELYVTEQTLKHVLVPERIDYIAFRLSAEYEKEFSASGIGKLERDIEEVEREIESCIDTIVAARGSAKVAERINARVEDLSIKKEELESELAQLRIAVSHKCTPDDFRLWLRSFSVLDLTDEDARRRIIDTFVSAVYVFDDKLLVYYNISHDGEGVVYEDAIKDIDAITGGSDFARSAPPRLFAATSEGGRLAAFFFPFEHISDFSCRDADLSALCDIMTRFSTLKHSCG